jgi:hypothetical protein
VKHALRFEEIFKTKLQAFWRSNPETLQSQNHRQCKIRLLSRAYKVLTANCLVFGVLRIVRLGVLETSWTPTKRASKSYLSLVVPSSG